MKKSSYILPFIIQATLWYLIMKPFFKFFTHLEVRGYENIKNEKAPLIFAPNHSSELDSVLLPLAFPFWSKFAPMFFVARETHFYQVDHFGFRRFFYGGWKFKMLGAFPLESGKKDYSKALKTHVAIIKSGGSLCIFPEGRFTRTGELGPAHGGVIHLTKETGAKVVPVHINGTFKINLMKVLSRKMHICINFLEPLSISDILGDSNPKPEEYNIYAEKILSLLKSNKATIM